MVRVTVSRLQGDAPALLYFTTEDGSAQAGLDYEATSGHVFFRARAKEKTVKVTSIGRASDAQGATTHTFAAPTPLIPRTPSPSTGDRDR